MRQAKKPFQFVAASYLIRIRPERARTLGDMGKHLRSCSEASIFYHTFQSLESHHYAAFSSDFAQWVLAACNEAGLAERLAAIDVRDFVTLEDLREELAGAVEEYLRRDPQTASRPAFEPFHFCEAIEHTVPLDRHAENLAELVDGIRDLGLQTLHYHLIDSRLRLKLATNDFSHWIREGLDLPKLADRINHIDFYTHTLEDVKEETVRAIEPWISK